MSQRNRKLIGVILILLSIVGWLAIGTGIYLLLPLDLHPLILIGYFLVAGMSWMFPAMAIIRWMAKPDAAPSR